MSLREVVNPRGGLPISPRTDPARPKGRWTRVLVPAIWIQLCLLAGLHAPSWLLPRSHTSTGGGEMSAMTRQIAQLRCDATDPLRELPLGSPAPDGMAMAANGRRTQLAAYRGHRTIVIFVEDGAG